MTSSAIYTGNSQVIIADGLKDRDGAAITNGTVRLVALVDNRGRDVTGVTLPLAMSHVGEGVYEGALPDDLGIRAGSIYKATVTADVAGVVGEWTETLVAQVRRA
jgi:hypothetical protein